MTQEGGRAACALYKPFEELQPRTQGPASPLKLAYCDFPVELPELEPELPLLEPEPMPPLLDPLLGGVLGDVVGLGEVLLLPLAPAPAPVLEPDLLKCASHSAREIWPSLFVSTDEKLGAEELELVAPPDSPPLEPDAALPPEDDAPEEGVLELEPEAAGADDDDDLSAPLVVLDEELCASVAPDSANNAAAVAALRTLSFNIG